MIINFCIFQIYWNKKKATNWETKVFFFFLQSNKVLMMVVREMAVD